MATDVLIDPTSGQIYWNDGTGSPESIAIKGDAINTISFTGYSASFSPGSTPAGALTLVTIKDSAGTDALVPGTSGFNLGSSTLRWNTFSTNANLSGTLVVSDSTISSSLITGSVKFNGGIAISGNASIGQSLNFYNTSNANYVGFKAGVTAANTLYTLPTNFPGAGTSVLQSDTSGTLSWTGIVGNATTSQNINVVSASTSANHPVLFTPSTGSASGAAVSTEPTFVYNPSTDILSVSGLAVTNTTASTSPTTGALVVTGGVGISGRLNVGDRDSSGFSNYTLAGFAVSINNQVNFLIQNAHPGGANHTRIILSGDSNNFAQIRFANSNSAFIYPNQLLIENTYGDVHITAGSGKTILIGGFTLNSTGALLTNTTASTSSTTGALRVTGGVGIGGSVSVGGRLQLFNGANYTAFVSSATGDTVYTLPPTSPATGSSVLQSTSAGVMSWVPLAASSGGVATGVASRMAYYASAGSAITDTYGFQYATSGTAQTVSIFGGAAIGSTIFVVSTPSSTSVRVGIGVSNPQFELEVNGEISATNKSFVINHPTKSGMKLRYGSLEGPENGVYVRGVSTSNIIELPDYWLGLVDHNTITVHLTPIGKNNSHYFIKCEDNKVYIGTSLFKKINCFYSIWAERKDVPKLTVEYEYGTLS